MRARMIQNYAHPENGCLSAGDVISADGSIGRQFDRKLIAELVDCGAAVGVDENGNPLLPKGEQATRAKPGEKATKGS